MERKIIDGSDPLNWFTTAPVTADGTAPLWIMGLGWIDPTTVACPTCGDEGFVVTAWGEGGDHETGPIAVAADGHFCSCEKGTERKAEQDAAAADYPNVDNAYDLERALAAEEPIVWFGDDEDNDVARF